MRIFGQLCKFINGECRFVHYQKEEKKELIHRVVSSVSSVNYMEKRPPQQNMR